MNPYRQAWYESTFVGIEDDPSVRRKIVKQKRSSGRGKKSFVRQVGSEMVSQAKQEAGLALGYQGLKYAARSQVTGRLGVALRVGGRVGLRAIPVVGAAIIAYDLYQFAKWVAD